MLMLCFATVARSQFIDRYARLIESGERECACGDEAPCQHIASTIVKEATGYGSISCAGACAIWDPASTNSMAGELFFYCCKGGSNPLSSCRVREEQDANRPSLSSVALAPRVVTVTLPVSGNNSSFPAVSTAAVAEAVAVASTPAPEPAGSVWTASDEHAVCSLACIVGVSAGAAVFALIVLFVALGLAKSRRARLAMVDRDVKDLQALHTFPGVTTPDPVYEQVSELEGSSPEYEYDQATHHEASSSQYEEPVAMEEVPQKQPLCFHNPLYREDLHGKIPDTPKEDSKYSELVYANPTTGEGRREYDTIEKGTSGECDV